jgi:hypothetical protein
MEIALISASVNFYAPCGDCHDEGLRDPLAFSMLRDQRLEFLRAVRRRLPYCLVEN